MAKKNVAAPVESPKPASEKAVAPAKPKDISAEERLAKLEARVAELEGDNLRLAQLCGQVWGEPLASAALEIVKKRQG